MSITFERERELDRFVQNEVKLNVTALVARMVELGDDVDIPPCAYDWQTAAEDDGWKLGADRKIFRKTDDYGYEEADSWEMACHSCGYTMEYYEREIFSWYAVSSFLADDLEDLGETVVRDWYGLDIWGRTTFGQAIGMDSAIQTIYDNLHKGDNNASGN